MSWVYKTKVALAYGVNPTLPDPGISAGDLLVIIGTSGAQFGTLAGWNQVLRDSTGHRLAVWWKIATGSEGGVALTNSGSTTVVAMGVWKGISDTPLDATSTKSTTTGTSLATNTLTTTADNDLVISIWGLGSGSSDGTGPAGTTTRLQRDPYTSPANYPYGFMLVEEKKASAGTTTARTATFSGSIGLSAISIAFKSAPDAAKSLFFGSNF